MFLNYSAKLKISKDYIINLLKWLLISVLIGAVSAFAGVLFHYAVDFALQTRSEHPFILYFLPLAGVIIVFLYHICDMDNDKGTNTVILAVRNGEKVSLLLAPVILISTALTHLCGGSSGREGAALQIGGSLGSFFARGLKLKNYDASVLVMCGMSGVFSAVFGTPLTAAIFSLEVVSVGIMHYGALLPAVVSAIVAKMIVVQFGVHATSFTLSFVPSFEPFIAVKVLILALLAALLSIVFIESMHGFGKLFAKYFKNKYIRVIVGGLTIILLTLLVGNYDYNGTGMEIIKSAVEKGTAFDYAFILKLLFTAVTLSSGFKGGEIVPTFFIGSTFGVFASKFLMLDPSFAAAVGLVALFCGVVNCPVASIILSVELFGAEGLLYFAIAVAASYFFSGNCSLYSSQKIVFSKLKAVMKDSE